MANGIVIIDKPSGWTSMDVCAKIRGILKEKRVGHGGTLDPMATGVLPVFVGQATRAVEFAENGEKEYIAGLRLGLVTNTQDTSGETLETHPVTVDRAALEAAPAPLHRPYRSRSRPCTPPSRSTAKSSTIWPARARRWSGSPAASPFLSWSYWNRSARRTICSAAAAPREHICGRCATISGKRWAAAAPCSVSAAPWPPGITLAEAVSLEDVQAQGEALLRPVESMFAAYPLYTLSSPGKEARVRNGNPITVPELADGTYRVHGKSGEFLCLSRAENGTLTSIKNFFGA